MIPARSEESLSERYIWLLLCPLLLIVSFARGLNVPNTWGSTQALVDYRFGFVKRGLVGATLGHWLNFDKFVHFADFALIVVLINLLLLCLIALYGGIRERLSTIEILPLFFSGYSITFLGYSAGYSDSLLACLILPLLFIRNSTVRLILGVVAGVVCILIHEAFLVLFLPLLLLTFLLQAVDRPDPGRPFSRSLLAKGALLLVICFGVTVRVALKPSLSAAQAAEMRDQIVQAADYKVDTEVFDVLRLSTADNVRFMLQKMRTANYWERQGLTMITMGPTILLFLLVIHEILRSRARKLPAWLVLCIYGAALSPLVLHAVAWDVERWNELTITNSFLAVVLLCRYASGPILALPYRLRYAMIFVMVFNLCSRLIAMEAKSIAGSQPSLRMIFHR